VGLFYNAPEPTRGLCKLRSNVLFAIGPTAAVLTYQPKYNFQAVFPAEELDLTEYCSSAEFVCCEHVFILTPSRPNCVDVRTSVVTGPDVNVKYSTRTIFFLS